MKLSCFIIDDEPLALGLLENYVNKTDFLELTGKFSSAVAALSALRTSPPQLIFLDIQMAELNGLELAQLVPAQTRIILTTAFQQYALEGYKVNALDYLLKPFSYSDFLNAAGKALEWFEMKMKAENMITEPNEPFIFVKADARLLRIEIRHILYAEGLKDYLKLYLDNDPKPIIVHMTMKNFESIVPKDKFLRVHKSFIVQTDHINIIERNRIVFGKTHIPISDSYKERFQQFMDGKIVN